MVFGHYNRYIMKSMLTSLLLATVAFVLFLFLAYWVRMMREGVLAERFLEAAPYFLMMAVPAVLPVAFVVAVSGVLSRAAAQNELLVMSASGLPLSRTTRPIYGIALLMSVFLWFANDQLIPESTEARMSLIRSFASQVLSVTNGRDRVIQLPDKIVYCRHYQDGRMEGLLLTGEEKGREIQMTAEKGTLRMDKEKDLVYLDLYNVRIQLISSDAVDVVECDRYVLCIPLTPKEHPRESFSSASALFRLSKRFGERVKKETDESKKERLFRYKSRCESEISRRAVMSLSPLLLLFLIIPVSIAIGESRHGGAPFVAVIMSILLFYVPLLAGHAVARRGMVMAYLPPASAVLVSVTASLLFRMLLKKR